MTVAHCSISSPDETKYLPFSLAPFLRGEGRGEGLEIVPSFKFRVSSFKYRPHFSSQIVEIAIQSPHNTAAAGFGKEFLGGELLFCKHLTPNAQTISRDNKHINKFEIKEIQCVIEGIQSKFYCLNPGL